MGEKIVPGLGISRRKLLKRGALVGGTLIWTAPVVATFGNEVFGAPAGTAPPCACSVSATALTLANCTTGSGQRRIFTIDVAIGGACGSPCVDDPNAGNEPQITSVTSTNTSGQLTAGPTVVDIDTFTIEFNLPSGNPTATETITVNTERTCNNLDTCTGTTNFTVTFRRGCTISVA